MQKVVKSILHYMHNVDSVDQIILLLSVDVHGASTSLTRDNTRKVQPVQTNHTKHKREMVFQK